MKKAIGYIRISTEDQSNFSLEGQERYIREYATKHDISILSMFKDDGKSAKNFDRPDWQKLEQFIRSHYKEVDYLIVINYTRFSRNAAEGLQKIELLEKRYQIIIVSVFEQMFIDYDSPYFFKQRADMLVNAEFELHVIRDRTKFGINQALSSGRYLGVAPFGYKNARDDRNKPIIVKHETHSLIVIQIYQDYLDGLPIQEIYHRARAAGMNKRSHNSIQRILTYCCYAGFIHVPAYRKEAERQVKGLHEAIIPESTWLEVQRRMGIRNQPRKNIVNEEVPLRGVLLCHCSKPLTAGNSKGKKKYYWYYRCHLHRDVNYSANKLHKQFTEVLQNMSLKETHIVYLKEAAEREMNSSLEARSQKIKAERLELITAEQRLTNLEEKFITEQINKETYSKWYKKYAAEVARLKFALSNLEGDSTEQWNLFRSQIHKLEDLEFLYQHCDVNQKQSFIRQVFNSALSYQGGIYRTPYMLEIFSHNAMILKEKGLLIYEQPYQKKHVFAQCTRDGS